MSNQAKIGIIAGTGFEEAFRGLAQNASGPLRVATSHGDVDMTFLMFDEEQAVALIPRHGHSHAVPPHRINHAANIRAFSEVGVELILATSAVGSVQPTLFPGELVLLNDFIDLRGGTPTTFYDGADGVVRHTDFSEPFCPRLRTALLEQTSLLCEDWSAAPTLYPQGTYLCLSGPRYETPAEVRLFRSWGADVVGMTVAPEAILARELGLSYAALAVVTNLGTGLSSVPLSHEEVTGEMARARPFVTTLFLSTIKRLLAEEQSV